MLLPASLSAADTGAAIGSSTPYLRVSRRGLLALARLLLPDGAGVPARLLLTGE
eukprot:COSAG06_NODE_5663_length_3335_cov_1.450556_3_plen_54_part_00